MPLEVKSKVRVLPPGYSPAGLPSFSEPLAHFPEPGMAPKTASLASMRATVLLPAPLLLGGFTLVSLVLAAVGIYGVLAYSVTERTREIGVRVALGADPGRILTLVLGSGMRLVFFGAMVGTGGALALTGLLKSLLFGVKAHDPATFAAAAVVLFAVALLAAYLPARRASRMAPVDALKVE